MTVSPFRPLAVARSALMAFVLMTGSSLIASAPSRAQSQAMPLSQTRAANLARMRAESLNGGLANYRADRCMYRTGAPACLVSRSSKGYVFRFQGGPPGWQQRKPAQPTTLTTVTVTPDGQSIQTVSNTALP